MLVELLGAVVEGVYQQRPHTSVLRNAHRATDGVLQQFTAMLDAPPGANPGLERLMAVKAPWSTGAA